MLIYFYFTKQTLVLKVWNLDFIFLTILKWETLKSNELTSLFCWCPFTVDLFYMSLPSTLLLTQGWAHCWTFRGSLSALSAVWALVRSPGVVRPIPCPVSRPFPSVSLSDLRAFCRLSLGRWARRVVSAAVSAVIFILLLSTQLFLFSMAFITSLRICYFYQSSFLAATSFGASDKGW